MPRMERGAGAEERAASDGRMDAGARELSRRDFVLAAAAAAAAMGATSVRASALTAQQVVDRIRARVGVPWAEKTVDGFKAGSPDAAVRGIATTVMATLPVLRAAAASGHNLVIALEPTFYTPTDEAGTRAADPVYLAKRAFIEEHGLVVWRFSDHWLARRPGEMAAGLAATLGWSAARAPDDPLVRTIPPTTLGALAAQVRSRLGMRGGMRVIGDLAMPIRSVLLSPGTSDLAAAVVGLTRADLILAGEPREWESVEYVFDTASAGRPKAMIAVGRLVSQEPGMRRCAEWLRGFIREVPVSSIPVGDPYWRPVA
jgi:hypothetical protein